MIPATLRLTLTSAATFGRGDGLVGLVDREIEHDEHGMPYLRGKTLKGLLLESAENVVFALEGRTPGKWHTAKETLFGQPGRGTLERGNMHISDARLPAGLRSEILKSNFSKSDVLYSLTGIRRQTAMNPDGGPEHATLRSMRVLLPGVMLEAELSFDSEPSQEELLLLTAAALDMRRGGTGRNRGRGHFVAVLDDEKTTQELFNQFAGEVRA